MAHWLKKLVQQSWNVGKFGKRKDRERKLSRSVIDRMNQEEIDEALPFEVTTEAQRKESQDDSEQDDWTVDVGKAG